MSNNFLHATTTTLQQLGPAFFAIRTWKSFRRATCSRRYHYRKTVFCRVPESSPCVLFRAHDEDLLCRGSPEEHTANKKHTGKLTIRRVPRASTRQTLIFAVCQPVGTRRTWITCGAHPSAVRGPHGRYCLPCARASHTANSHLRRGPVGRHTAKSPAAVCLS